MKTDWDYTHLAKAYLKRPDYSEDALQSLFELSELSESSRVCDVGAGVAHLTLALARAGCLVDAVEPNDAMRQLGSMRTKDNRRISWFEGTGEVTGMVSSSYSMVTFGSSFNVTDRLKTLAEVERIALPQAWFAAMWNHRDINDEIQSEIETIISSAIPGYDYGTRREDQEEFLKRSGYLKSVIKLEGEVVHDILVEDVLEAWRSHATLQRQAGPKFDDIINAIASLLGSIGADRIEVPYTTRIWAGQLKN